MNEQAQPMSLRFVWNAPNVLTVVRFCLVPVFVVLFFGSHLYTALGVFALAAATDVVDGYLARRCGQVTDFGRLMDPLADKLMTLTCATCLCISERLPLFWLLVIIGKELMMIIGSIVLYKKREKVVSANKVGKGMAVLMFCVLVSAFFAEYIWPGLMMGIQLLALVAALLTGFNYAWQYMIRPKREERAR